MPGYPEGNIGGKLEAFHEFTELMKRLFFHWFGDMQIHVLVVSSSLCLRHAINRLQANPRFS